MKPFADLGSVGPGGALPPQEAQIPPLQGGQVLVNKEIIVCLVIIEVQLFFLAWNKTT